MGDEALVEELLERTRSFSDRQLVDLLRPLLAPRPLQPLIEYVAERMHHDTGERELTFHLSDGNLRRSGFKGHPVGNQELEHLARS